MDHYNMNIWYNWLSLLSHASSLSSATWCMGVCVGVSPSTRIIIIHRLYAFNVLYTCKYEMLENYEKHFFTHTRNYVGLGVLMLLRLASPGILLLLNHHCDSCSWCSCCSLLPCILFGAWIGVSATTTVLNVIVCVCALGASRSPPSG